MTTPRTLGIWYADPLSADEAQALLTRSEQRESQRKRHGGNTLTCRLQRLIAQFWLGQPIYDEYLMLKPVAMRSAHGLALLELVYGQLLLSRKLDEGMAHLDKAFRLVANLFAAGDYLLVMNRHRLLRQLPLSGTAAKPEPLTALLTSAQVIERMRQTETKRTTLRHDPKDTYG